MDTVYRYLAALRASRAVPQYSTECRVVVTKMTGSPVFASLAALLTQTTLHLNTLDAANEASLKGPKGSAATRNAALFVVRGDMRQIRTGVQVAADADIVNARAIIEGAGWFAVKRGAQTKPILAAKYGAIPGLLQLIAKAVRRAVSYHWQMSSDGKVFSDLAPTTEASTPVTGLTPATLYYFRFRTFGKAGYSDWSVTISVIAH